MSRDVTVSLGERSYGIHIDVGLLDRMGEVCRDLGLGRACLVVSDSNVDALYGERCEAALKGAGFEAGRAVVPAGETSKSETRLFDLYNMALDDGLDRGSFVVALGGGVVGDLAGYMAASYLRGIQLVQVPTTLLAMVDSSVGGKTGINLPQGKNLVGAFYQPAVVATDLETLRTLPEREFVSGLAEVVKHGVIRDAGFFAFLDENRSGIAKQDFSVLEEVVARCCEIKGDVVEQDEREGGLRAILNFGHTFAHALEQVSDYERYLHGEAVSIGMVFAARLSVVEHGFPQADCDRLVDLLQGLGLPVELPEYDWMVLRKAMSVDKKTKDQALRFVLAKQIGSVTPGCEVSDEALTKVFEEMSED